MSNQIPRDRPSSDVVSLAPFANMATRASRGVERGDDGLHGLGQMAEDRPYWRLPYSQGRLIEHYLHADVGIVFRRKESRTHACCREPKQDGFSLSMPPHSRVRHKHRKANGSWRWPELDQAPVLSDVVELIEDEQRFVPSSIWSHTFDRGDFSLRKPLFAFMGLEVVHKVKLAPMDGEMKIGILFHAVAGEYRSEQEIKAAPEGIDDRPNPGVENGVWWSKAVADHQHISRMLRVRLHFDHIWAAPKKGFESLFETWDLGYGPVDCSLGI